MGRFYPIRIFAFFGYSCKILKLNIMIQSFLELQELRRITAINPTRSIGSLLGELEVQCQPLCCAIGFDEIAEAAPNFSDRLTADQKLQILEHYAEYLDWTEVFEEIRDSVESVVGGVE